MKNYLILIVAFLVFGCAKEQPVQKTEATKNANTNAKEALLIGTFHYNNPGADVAKTKSFDILSESSQTELQEMSAGITKYNPTQVFVEWPYDEQADLDSLYQVYLKGEYFKNEKLSDFYRKNEIFQLAFRVAKENGLEKVYAIDYKTSFPFGEVMEDLEKNNQGALKSEIEETIAKFTKEFDDKIDAGVSLKELTYYLNTPKMNKLSNYLHNDLMLRAGGTTDFSGPLLTSEWFKRNLYMWSMIQKQTNPDDQKIMVLAGSSHTAMFELFIKENEDWKMKNFKEVMQEY